MKHKLLMSKQIKNERDLMLFHIFKAKECQNRCSCELIDVNWAAALQIWKTREWMPKENEQTKSRTKRKKKFKIK